MLLGSGAHPRAVRGALAPVRVGSRASRARTAIGALCVCVAIVVAAPPDSPAAVAYGERYRVSTTDANDTDAAQQGQTETYLAGWVRESETSPQAVYVRLLGSGGQPLGQPHLIAEGERQTSNPALTKKSVRRPGIAWNAAANSWIIVWTETAFVEGGSGSGVGSVKAMALDASGMPLPGTRHVVVGSVGEPRAGIDPPVPTGDTRPRVRCGAADGSCGVAWEAHTGASPDLRTHVMYRRLGPDGTPAGPQVELDGPSSRPLEGVQLEWRAGAGEWLAVWATLAGGLHSQRVSAGGDAIGVNLALAPPRPGQTTNHLRTVENPSRGELLLASRFTTAHTVHNLTYLERLGDAAVVNGSWIPASNGNLVPGTPACGVTGVCLAPLWGANDFELTVREINALGRLGPLHSLEGRSNQIVALSTSAPDRWVLVYHDEPRDDKMPGAAVAREITLSATDSSGPADGSTIASPARVAGYIAAPTVRKRGASRYRALRVNERLASGTYLDASRGAIALVTRKADGAPGRMLVYGGRFQLLRDRSSEAIVVARLISSGSAIRCGGGTTSRVLRRLWSDGNGRFRVRGKYATATVRGTKWLVEDRCDGTVVRVRAGTVEVRDTPRRRTQRVRAPRSYLATAPRQGSMK